MLPSELAKKKGWKGYDPSIPGHPEDQAFDFIQKSKQPAQLIDSITAYISVDEFGNEGLIAFNLGGQWLPAIACDEQRVASIEPEVLKIVDQLKIKVRKIKLSTRTDLATFGE